MEKLSVVIIAGNEEKNIRDCLESVKWADEIIVIDSESSDNSRQIAESYTSKIFIKKWEGFVPQRKYSIEKTSYDWVLSIDADERVSDGLKTEIQELLRSNNKLNGYRIPRQNYFLDKVITSCGWYPDYQMRLFNKNFVKLSDRKVHEGFEVDGKTAQLKNHLIHFTHQNITDTIKKINEYSYLQALEKKDGKRVRAINFILNPIAAFLNHFVGRRGFKDGIYGLMVSIIHSMTNLLTYMKTWELQNKSLDKYDEKK
ncbi:MAG: glycosyltransferase family 2 protein [Ignavibacteria bacterium]|nr:glycosyltransferase family 2 protein [Ignavibacteria bacterium]